MYHAIVRRRVRRMFERHLSQGEWDALLAPMAPEVHHVFPGDSPIGGERHTREAVGRWFERLGRLFPGHDFEVDAVVSRGWPWRSRVAVQWTARLAPAAGSPYVNEGAHWIDLRWGRVTRFHAYLDTERVAAACRELAAAGVEEAAAPPVADAA